MNIRLRNIMLEEIDFTDLTYKITRNVVADKLFQSVTRHGILSPPILLKNDNNFIIICGHNRLSMALRCGLQSCFCQIIDNLHLNMLLHCSLKKNYHGEIGPVGKIKLIRILTLINSEKADEINRIARHDLGVPEFIFSDPAGMTTILSLPQSLSDYIDSRDPGYKTIRDLIRLPHETLEIIDAWLKSTQLRVNVFREIVDYLYDIYRRDGSTESVGKINYIEIKDHRAREQYIYSRLREIRFPEYSRMIEKAEKIIGGFRGKGINIVLPPHFEGDSIGITLELSRKDGLEPLQKKIAELDLQELRNLLELL